MDFEQWLDIEGFPDYCVSNRGRVYSRKTEKIMRGRPVSDGYLQVGLYRDGVRSWKYVSVLVAEAFLLNPEGLPDVDHIDHNRANNDVSNLRWLTHRKNQFYRRRDGMASQFFGVSRAGKKWQVTIDRKYRGTFPTELEAARYFNRLAPSILGPDALLNDIPPEAPIATV